MPIIRIVVPEGHTAERKRALRTRLRECVTRTWAKEHIYIAIREMFSEPGEQTVIMTVDLRPGRGHEAQRAEALFETSLAAFSETMGTRREDLVLLLREFPETGFIVGGGRLPSLAAITPDLLDSGEPITSTRNKS